MRAGQTEGSVDLARLAGLTPAGVICEIMNDDGTMARMPDLEQFRRQARPHILTIADLIEYRLQTEQLVRMVDESDIRARSHRHPWRAMVFEPSDRRAPVPGAGQGRRRRGGPDALPHAPRLDARRHLQLDAWTKAGATSTRRSTPSSARGRGVVVYLPPRGDLRQELLSLRSRREARSSPIAASSPVTSSEPLASAGSGAVSMAHRGTLREYGLGAQVLRELGLHRLRLLTNNPKKIAGIQGFGLEVVESVPLISMRGS